MVEFVPSSRSQGDRKGRPYKERGELTTGRIFVGATLAVALEAISPRVAPSLP